MNKLRIILIVLLFSSLTFIYGQDTGAEQNDKYTTQNIMLTRITECRYGLILEYFSGVDLKTSYIPNKFFIDGTAVKIVENDTNISPQMNIIYKNLKPFKVKLYLATNVASLTYRYMDFVSSEIAEKFKVEGLTFEK